MQTTMAFVAAQPARVAAPKASRRSAVVVRASAEESRRAVLGGLLAGVAALTASTANAAVYNDFVDDRKAKANGFDIVYEARELDLPQAVRDGLAQARADIEGTKKRIAESERRLDSELEAVIKKNYWTEGREQLRRQVGTLRFDINTLAENLPKSAKKEALAAKKEFFAVVDDLDFALRTKDEAKALKALEKAKASLDTVLSKVL